jgi:hypothetical protein
MIVTEIVANKDIKTNGNGNGDGNGYSIFDNIENSTNNIKFLYLFIFVTSIYISSHLDITINIIFAIMISIFIIIYLNHNNQKRLKDDEEIVDIQYREIRPKSEKVKDYPEILKILYFMQDLYPYNPQAFEEIIDNIDVFLETYEESKELIELSGKNYKLAEKYKRNILNNIHSLIITIPANNLMSNKIDKHTNKMNNILSQMLQEIKYLNAEYTHDNGYNTSTVIINNGPKEANHFANSFEIY